MQQRVRRRSHRVQSCLISSNLSFNDKKPDKISRVFMAEKQGFVLAFCKAVRFRYIYALQKSSGSR